MVAQIFKYDKEFITTDSKNLLPFSQFRCHLFREVNEYFITDYMTMVVIDLFEMINVYDHDTDVVLIDFGNIENAFSIFV